MSTTGVNTKLTKREKEVLQYLNEANSRTEIAKILTVSVRTVDFHITNIYLKLEAHSIVKVLHKARALGYLV